MVQGPLGIIACTYMIYEQSCVYINSVIVTSLIIFASLIDYSVFNAIALISTPVTLV